MYANLYILNRYWRNSNCCSCSKYVVSSLVNLFIKSLNQRSAKSKSSQVKSSLWRSRTPYPGHPGYVTFFGETNASFFSFSTLSRLATTYSAIFTSFEPKRLLDTYLNLILIKLIYQTTAHCRSGWKSRRHFVRDGYTLNLCSQKRIDCKERLKIAYLDCQQGCPTKTSTAKSSGEADV